MNGRHDCFVGEIVRLFPIGEKFIQPLSRRGYRWKEWSDFRKIGIGRISQRERERKKVKSSVSGWHIGSKFHCETNRLPPQEFALCDVLAHDRATTSPRLWQKYMEIECFDGGTNYRLEKIFHQLRK